MKITVKVDDVVAMANETMIVFNKVTIDIICNALKDIQKNWITIPDVKTAIDKTTLKMLKIRQKMKRDQQDDSC